VQAEREVVDMYRAYLMRDRIGDELDGVVSAVTGFGLFVEIPDPFVEGLIRAESLGPGGYDFDPERLRLTGRRSGRSFALGDKLRVAISSVSVPRRRIDLALVEGERALPVAAMPSSPPPRRGRDKARRRRG